MGAEGAAADAGADADAAHMPMMADARVAPDAAPDPADQPSDAAASLPDAGAEAGDAAPAPGPDAMVAPLDAGADPDAGGAACPDAWPAPPAERSSVPFERDGQAGFRHDELDRYGFFHTYDALQVCGPGDAARQVHVLLPRGYDEGERRHPVLYVNDGNTTFWRGGLGDRTLGVQDVLGALAPACEVAPPIVVAIHPLDRRVEYTHAAFDEGAPCCGLDGYLSYVADCVKPFVDAQYRTRPEPESTGFMGASHGGLAAFAAATWRPDVWGFAVAQSSSFWVGVDFDRVHAPEVALADSPLVARMAEAVSTPARPRLWLDWGLARDGGDHNAVTEHLATLRGREMAALLRETFGYTEGADLFVVEEPEGRHEEDSWGARLPDAFRAVLPPDAP